jgi:hypothetical protein
VCLVGLGSCLYDEKINPSETFSSSNFAMATVLHRTPEPFARSLFATGRSMRPWRAVA